MNASDSGMSLPRRFAVAGVGTAIGLAAGAVLIAGWERIRLAVDGLFPTAITQLAVLIALVLVCLVCYLICAMIVVGIIDSLKQLRELGLAEALDRYWKRALAVPASLSLVVIELQFGPTGEYAGVASLPLSTVPAWTGLRYGLSGKPLKDCFESALVDATILYLLDIFGVFEWFVR